MSNDVVKYQAPSALTVTREAAEAVKEAFAINMEGGSVSEFDISRLKFMNGAPYILAPGLERDETIQRLECVIVYHRDVRTYYPTKNAGKVPPTCSSRDGHVGFGKPGGDCSACSLAKFESAQDSNAQACKAGKQMFIMRGESLFPEILTIPPTSLKAARQYILRLTTQGVAYYSALVAIEVEKAENPQGQIYGKAAFKFLRRLTPEETLRAMEYHQMAKALAGNLAADAGGDQPEQGA